MADNWFLDIFSWEKLMAIFSVFSILASTAFIPLYHLYRSRQEKKARLLEQEQIKRIDDAVKPLIKKIEQLDETLHDTQIILDSIKESIKKTCTELSNHIEKAEQMNRKIYYMDGMFKRMSSMRGLPEDGDVNGLGA